MNRTMFALALIALGGPAAAGEWSKGYTGYSANGTYFAPYHRLDGNAASSNGRGNKEVAGPQGAYEGHPREAFNDAFLGARLQSPYRSNRSAPYSWWK